MGSPPKTERDWPMIWQMDLTTDCKDWLEEYQKLIANWIQAHSHGCLSKSPLLFSVVVLWNCTQCLRRVYKNWRRSNNTLKNYQTTPRKLYQDKAMSRSAYNSHTYCHKHTEYSFLQRSSCWLHSHCVRLILLGTLSADYSVCYYGSRAKDVQDSN